MKEVSTPLSKLRRRSHNNQDEEESPSCELITSSSCPTQHPVVVMDCEDYCYPQYYSKRSHHHGQTKTKIGIMLTLCFMMLGVWCMISLYHHLDVFARYQPAEVASEDDIIDYDAPACTFHQIEQNFVPAKNATTVDNNNDNAGGGDCWNLSDDIIRIPLEAIMNRNTMIPLGNGRNGAVFRVVLKLPKTTTENDDDNDDDGSHYHDQCTAVFKTELTFSDYCENLWNNPIENLKRPIENLEYTWKCIEAHWLGFSHLGGEYTGAIPFYASRRHRRRPEQQQQALTFSENGGGGLIPTWAIVTQKSVQPPIWIGRVLNQMFSWANVNTPHPNKHIVGVIMPFVPVKTLRNLFLTEEKEGDNGSSLPSVSVHPLLSNHTTSSIAKKLLPAAEGLAFVHELGVAFQDISNYNIGFRVKKNNDNEDSLGDAVVFDNSFMGWQASPSPSSAPSSKCDDNNACATTNVCPDPAFPGHYKYYNTNLTPMYYGPPADLRRLKQAINEVMDVCCNEEEGVVLDQIKLHVDRTHSAKELVQVLKRVVMAAPWYAVS